MGQLQTWALTGLLGLLIGFGGGWKVNGWKYESERVAEAQAFNTFLDYSAKELAKLEIKNVTIKQQMETKVVERPVYRECFHDDVGMQLINQALSSKPLSNSQLPGVSPTK